MKLTSLSEKLSDLRIQNENEKRWARVGVKYLKNGAVNEMVLEFWSL